MGDLYRHCLRTKETQERNHAHFSPCPIIHKWLRLGLFPSASGHGLSVMTLFISPVRQSAGWLISPAAAGLAFITVSVRDKDKLQSRRAARGFIPQARFSLTNMLSTPPFHNKATASDYICPQSFIKSSTDRQ